MRADKEILLARRPLWLTVLLAKGVSKIWAFPLPSKCVHPNEWKSLNVAVLLPLYNQRKDRKDRKLAACGSRRSSAGRRLSAGVAPCLLGPKSLWLPDMSLALVHGVLRAPVRPA